MMWTLRVILNGSISEFKILVRIRESSSTCLTFWNRKAYLMKAWNPLSYLRRSKNVNKKAGFEVVRTYLIFKIIIVESIWLTIKGAITLLHFHISLSTILILCILLTRFLTHTLISWMNYQPLRNKSWNLLVAIHYVEHLQGTVVIISL
jgi:hypothetical protein